MPSKNCILTSFSLGCLQAVSRKLQVTVQDRRRKDFIVAALVKDRSTSFEEVIGSMPAADVKAACQELELDVQGRGKAAYAAALVAAAAPKTKAASKASKAPKAAKATKAAAAKAAPMAETKAARGEPKIKPTAAEAKAAPKPTPAASKAGKKFPGLEAARAARAKKAEQAQAAAAAVTPSSAVKAPHSAKATKPAVAKPMISAPDVALEPEPVAEAPEPITVKATTKPKRGPLSWSEAAQMAEHRGQSAATMLRAPAPQTTGTAQHTCTKCHKAVTVQACQVQACNNYYVAAPGRKICSECLFERNTISMDDFNDRLHEERQCTHCGVPMTHLASVGNA